MRLDAACDGAAALAELMGEEDPHVDKVRACLADVPLLVAEMAELDKERRVLMSMVWNLRDQLRDSRTTLTSLREG
jgi:hypothetical protein